MHGEPHQLRGPDLLVDNGLIHAEILALFAEIFRGEYRVPIPRI
jgi:myo-inositol-1(or 4)-monophosphatase